MPNADQPQSEHPTDLGSAPGQGGWPTDASSPAHQGFQPRDHTRGDQVVREVRGPSDAHLCQQLSPALVRAGLARLVTPRQDERELGQLVGQYAQALHLEQAQEGDGAAAGTGEPTGHGQAGERGEAGEPGPGRWLFGTIEPSLAGSKLPVLGQVVLLVPSPGRTVGVYVSRDAEPTDLPPVFGGARFSAAPRSVRAQQRAALVDYARRWLIERSARVNRNPADSAPLDLAQALIEPHEGDAREALLAGGFAPLAELAYMRTDVPLKPPVLPAWPQGVQVVSLAKFGWPTGQPSLLRAMARSYIGTLDCPALCDIRRPVDVLTSHLAVGNFDPSLWFLVLMGDQPEGCMLVTRFADHDTAELVYLGLGPSLRGKGLAAALLDMAMIELAARGTASLACAVDTTNTPALKLYKAARFRRFARRLGFVADVRARPLSDPPQAHA